MRCTITKSNTWISNCTYWNLSEDLMEIDVWSTHIGLNATIGMVMACDFGRPSMKPKHITCLIKTWNLFNPIFPIADVNWAKLLKSSSSSWRREEMRSSFNLAFLVSKFYSKNSPICVSRCCYVFKC